MHRVELAWFRRHAFLVWLLLGLMSLLAMPAAADECVFPDASDASRRYCTPVNGELPRGVAPDRLFPPLKYLQVIFGFFDRRFPGYNGGLEHAGVDFAAAAGTTVYAICDGTAVLTRTDRPEIMLAVLVVEHQCPEPLGRVHAYYGHIYSTLMEGDGVSAGDAIGTVRDWQGNSHLHFGLSRSLMEENWGVHPRGATLQGLLGMSWLDPLQYFAVAVPAPVVAPVVQRPAPKPVVQRPIAPRKPVTKPKR